MGGEINTPPSPETTPEAPANPAESGLAEVPPAENLPENILVSDIGAETAPAPAPLEATDTGGSLPDLKTLLEDEPGSPPVIPGPAGENHAAGDEMVKFFVTDERLNQLWDRTEHARKTIETQIDNLPIADALLDQIQYTRNELLSGRSGYDHAERHLNEVEYRIALHQRVSRWSDTLAFGLFFYEVVWGVVFAAILFIGLGQTAFASGSGDLVYLAGSMVWAGLGGVMGALYMLVKHVARLQDFDREQRIWYYYSPIIALGVGAVIYIILRAGLLSINGNTEKIQSPLIIYVLCVLAGYQNNIFTELVHRIMKVFQFGEDKPAAASGNPKPPQVLAGNLPVEPAPGSDGTSTNGSAG